MDHLLAVGVAVCCAGGRPAEPNQAHARGGIDTCEGIARLPARKVGVHHLFSLDDTHRRIPSIARTEPAIASATVSAKVSARSPVAQYGSPYQPSASISVTSVM